MPNEAAIGGNKPGVGPNKAGSGEVSGTVTENQRETKHQLEFLLGR